MLQVASQPNVPQLVKQSTSSVSQSSTQTQPCIQLEPCSVAQSASAQQNVDHPPGSHNGTPPGHVQAAPVVVPVHEIILAKQLSHLASQHHSSEYNRLKYGVKGSPYAYVPLTLQLPDHVLKLQEQQALHAKQKAWWPSNPSPQSSVRHTPNPSVFIDPSSRGRSVHAADTASKGKLPLSMPPLVASRPDWQQELSAAIASTLPGSGSIHQTKTSETHPINISMVVPVEHLPILSSYLSQAPDNVPVMFQVPEHCQLDRVTAITLPGSHLLATQFRQRQPSNKSSPHINGSSPSHASHSDGLRGYQNLTLQHGDSHFSPTAPNATPNSHSRQPIHADAPFKPVFDVYHKERPVVPSLIVPSHKDGVGEMNGLGPIESPPISNTDTDIAPATTPPTGGAARDIVNAPVRLSSVPPQFVPTIPPQPPSPPTGVIRRPRHKHKRASSAPPDMATFRNARGGTTGASFRVWGNRTDVRALPRNRSLDAMCPTPTSPFLLTPPILVPSSVPPPDVQLDGVQAKITLAPHISRDNSTSSQFSVSTSSSQIVSPNGQSQGVSPQYPSPSTTPPTSAPTSSPCSPLTLISLTQNPAYLKRRTPNGLHVIPNTNGFGNSFAPYLGNSGLGAGSVSTYSGSSNGDASLPKITRLGNMFLSSCPGKKVRLSGPVKGRGAICRDLRQDLKRMKEVGVGCVICCLDDAELDYLGASWSEYSSVASELGLDVLRLPTPEGLAPLTPALLDSHLSRIIDSYTLQGIPILAHCRGGVGRAGLVACCWLLKLGLVGWKDPSLCICVDGCKMTRSASAPSLVTNTHAGSCSERTHAPPPFALCNCGCGIPVGRVHHTGHGLEPSPIHINGVIQTESPVSENSSPVSPMVHSRSLSFLTPRTRQRPRPACRSTIHLIERVISVVRRRRSLKAVETYEQVKFLASFVEHLETVAEEWAKGSIPGIDPAAKENKDHEGAYVFSNAGVVCDID